MRVFSVEMLVKEEGAAVVEAALKKLKAEAGAVGAQLKTTTQAVAGTGTAMQKAGQATEIAKDRAAKAAIGFAAVGQSIARTGSITADAGTRIIEAGSQIAMMFGPKGLAVAALLGFATAALTSFGKASAEAKKMEEAFQKSINGMVNQGDIIALTKQLRDLEMGIPSGALDEIVDVSDGIVAMRTRIKELQESGFTAFNRANREELKRLTDGLKEAEMQAKKLRAAILGAPAPAGEPGAAPISITGTLGSGGGRLGAMPAAGGAISAFEQRAAEQFAMVGGKLKTVVQAGIPAVSGIVLSEVARAAADLQIQIQQTFQESVGGALVGGIVGGIEQAVASGNIGEGFKALGSMLLAGVGDAMIKFGMSTAAFSKFMGKIMLSLTTLNPAAGLALSLALIGVGAALKGAARGMFGGQGGGAAFSTASFGGGSLGGGGGGLSGSLPTTQLIFGQTSATTAAGMTPRSATNITVIGPNDPSAQRAIQELLTKADSRGRLG